MDAYIIISKGSDVDAGVADPRIEPGPACTGATVYYSRDDAEVAFDKIEAGNPGSFEIVLVEIELVTRLRRGL